VSVVYTTLSIVLLDITSQKMETASLAEAHRLEKGYELILALLALGYTPGAVV
jgi:hypothetical protein